MFWIKNINTMHALSKVVVVVVVVVVKKKRKNK